MSEPHPTDDTLTDHRSLEAGTVLQVTHAFSKTRGDELDLSPGELITVLECPDGGWCKGVKGIETKNPTTGWFPVVISKVFNQPDNFNSDEALLSNDAAPPIGHKRSRSNSIFGKALRLKSDEKISRTRSTSAPSHGTSFHSLSLSNDLESVADASIVSINLINTTNDIPALKLRDSDRKDDSNRSSAQPRPLLSLKGSFSSPPTKEYMALKELADTEWHYLQDLYLIRHFRKVASKLLALSDRAIKTLFGNLDQLIHVHELLNDDLEVLIVQGVQSASQLANIFAARMEDFLAYIEYGNNYQLGQDKLKRLSKKVNSRDVFKRMSTQPRSRQLSLESFLIAPIQRICKYPLLLKQIIKDFEADGRDTASLKDALVNMEKNMILINDAIKQSSTTKKPAKSTKKSFEKPGCTILKEEKIFIQLDKKNKKKGYIYLLNDSVVIAKRSWGGKWNTILDVSLTDPSFSMSPSEKNGECIVNVKESSLLISFRSSAVQQSFKKTYSSLLESCKGSKSSVVFDAVVALDRVGDLSDDESDFSDDAGFSTSTLSLESPTPATHGSMVEVYQSIPSPDKSPKIEELELVLKSSSLAVEMLQKENHEMTLENEKLKESVSNLEDLRDNLMTRVNYLEEKNEDLKSNVINLEDQFEILKNDTANILIETEKCHSDLREEISYYKDIEERLNSANLRAEDLAEKNESLSSKKLLLELEFEALKQELGDEYKVLANQNIKSTNEMEEIRKEGESLKVTVSKLQDQIARNEETLQSMLQNKSEQENLISSISAANEKLMDDYQILEAENKSLFDRISVLLSVEDVTDRNQISGLFEKEVKRLLQLQTDYLQLLDEKQKLKNQLSFENENLKTKLHNSETSIESGLRKLNQLEDKITLLMSENSLREVNLEHKQSEINQLTLVIENAKMNDLLLIKSTEEHKELLQKMTLEHQQLQTDYKTLQISQKEIIDKISSYISLENSSDINESISRIEEETKRLIKFEDEYNTLKTLYQKANQEKDQLELQLKGYSEDQGAQNESMKKEYDTLQEKFNLLLNDLHNNQGILFTMEKELSKKNSKLNDLEARLQASANEIYQLKGYMSESTRAFNDERLSLRDHIKKLEERSDRTQAPQQVPPDFYYAMISKLEKEMLENKTQLIESKETLKAELKHSQAQYDKRGYCLRKLYSQLQEALAEKEKLFSRHTNSQREIQDLQIDKSKLIVEQEALKRRIEVLHDHLASANEKSVFEHHVRGRKYVRSDYESKDLNASDLKSEKALKVWKTIFFEIEVILGLSERSKNNLPTLDEEARVANTVSKIRNIVKEIKAARKQNAEAQDKIMIMGESLRTYDDRMNELLSSITVMAQDIKSKTTEFENQIYQKNIMIDDLVKKTASNDAIEALRSVKQERHNYELRLRDSNELVRQLSAEISVLKAELEKSEKTVSDQEVMISDFCLKTQRLQGQIMRLQERLDEAQALEADHIFELDKMEKKLEEIGKKKVDFKSDHSISLNSTDTLTSGRSLNLVNHPASTPL